MQPCDHCDNCTRDRNSVDHRDVTGLAWKILSLAEAVHDQQGRLTVAQLVDIARGTGKGEFTVVSRGRKGGGKGSITAKDRESLIGEVIDLSKEVCCRASVEAVNA